MTTGDASFAIAGESGGPAHYGSPDDEYEAAVRGCGVVFRGDRGLIRVHGRAPGQMLHGILTNKIPAPPTSAADPEVQRGEMVYGAILTPKGRMITDLRTFWLGAGEAQGIGLDVALAGKNGMQGHFARCLPPRLAAFTDLSGSVGLLTVLDPGAGEIIGSVFGEAPTTGYVLLEGGPLAGGLMVSRGVEQVPSWDIRAPFDRLGPLWERLGRLGAVPVGWQAWNTLRVEAGYPAFGTDMDETTIPIEAGLGDRAFDHGKGCYTGQEVIVRILHRGRVNWHLRALRFGKATATPGDELFATGGKKKLGRVTSAVRSPRLGGTGLGYVRREVEPPATLYLRSGTGPEVHVEAL